MYATKFCVVVFGLEMSFSQPNSYPNSDLVSKIFLFFLQDKTAKSTSFKTSRQNRLSFRQKRPKNHHTCWNKKRTALNILKSVSSLSDCFNIISVVLALFQVR